MILLTINYIKEMFRKPSLWILFGVVIILSGIWTYSSLESQKTRTFIGDDVYERGGRFAYDLEEFTQGYGIEATSEQVAAARLRNEMEKKLVDENIMGQRHTYVKNHLRREVYDFRFGYRNLDSVQAVKFKETILPMWENLYEDLEYDDPRYDFELLPKARDSDYKGELKGIEYYYYLFEKDLLPVYSDDLHPVSYWYDFSIEYLPYLTLFVVIFLGFQSINKEKNNGALKLILTNGVSRRKYYMSKWLSGLFICFMILWLPVLVYGLGLGLYANDFSLNYPVAGLEDHLSSFQAPPNYYEMSLSNGPMYDFPRLISRLIPRGTAFNSQPVEEMIWLAFYKQYIHFILMSMFVIGFLYAFVMIFSSLINQTIIALILTGGVLIGLIYISLPYTQGVNTNLSPFGMINASRNVIGINNTTTLKSYIILLASTMICLMIGSQILNKKSV